MKKDKTVLSSILAWKIAWMEELGRLQSMGLKSRTQLSTRAQHRTLILDETLFPAKEYLPGQYLSLVL